MLGRGRNRRVPDGDPSAHGETAAFKCAGRQVSYRGTTMVTTLSPRCWYYSGLVRHLGVSRVQLMTDFIAAHPPLWNQDIEVHE